MTKLPARSARRSADETRSLLIAAATDLFAGKGYATTGTREIAAAAGVPERLLFRHFGTKAELFLQVVAAPLREFVTRFCARWDEREAAGRTLDDIAAEFSKELMALFTLHRGLLLDLASVIRDGQDESTKVTSELFAPLFDVVVAHARTEARKTGHNLAHVPFDVRFAFALVLSLALFQDLLFVGSQPGRQRLLKEVARFILHGSNAPAGGDTP